MGAVPQSVPSAVAPSAGNSVRINEKAQRGPYKPMSGSSYVPAVPRAVEPDPEMAQQPGYGGTGSVSSTLSNGAGAPSVPALGGVLFTAPPIDAHYQNETEARNPYAVNRPVAPGLVTWVKGFANHVFQGKQNVSSTGWQQPAPQQRTSWMRITPPAHGAGYAPQTYIPRQLPQSDATYKYNPVTGTTAPGKVLGQGVVLNSSTFGAGQTAGGQGGNQYTPAPGPPPTTSTAGNAANASGYPTWG